MTNPIQEELIAALAKAGVKLEKNFTGKLTTHFSQGAVQDFEKIERIKPLASVNP